MATIATLSYSSGLLSNSPSTTKKTRNPSITANLKQHRKTTQENPAELLASRLGLDLTIAGLERLFLQPPIPPDPAPRRRPIRVTYQGVRGSYCHEASAASFPSASPFPSGPLMEDAFSALESGSADRALVPAENSLDGPVHRNLDLLLRHPAVRITRELVLPVNHCLMATPSASLSDLRRVVSHPQALGHCNRRLLSLGVDVEEVADAAGAARAVAEDGVRDTAVIGSRIAAREFGLRVLEEGFHDEGGNYNRFFELGIGDGRGTGCCGGERKTTVAFSPEEGAAGLCRALWVFANRGVRVERVDHRPNRANPVRFVDGAVRMEYVFVADVEGGEEDADVASAVRGLEEISSFVRVLGSYSCD